MSTPQSRGRLGILVAGGPAPGINSGISAVTIEALNCGLEVVGIYDGYEHLALGRTDMVQLLTVDQVSRIHFQGGSILRTARRNITNNSEDLQRTVGALKALGIRYLVTIGGDGTATTSRVIAKAAKGALRIAQLPKTIDNDLPMPGGMPTFGYETARHVASEMVLNLMEDSRSTNRWYFVVVMGRGAGHLALGIGRATGATLTVIPEEFTQPQVSVADVCDVLEGAIIKRQVMGREHGVAVIAEGVGTKIDSRELATRPEVELTYDTTGRIQLSDIPLASILRREVQHRLLARGARQHITESTFGYSLRSAEPVPYDIDYTRTLGHGAVGFLLSDVQDPRLADGGLVCLLDGNLVVLPFDEIHDPSTGSTKVRLVDMGSQAYQVARDYMIRIDPEDLVNTEMLSKLAEAANMSTSDFRWRYAKAAGRGKNL